MQASQALRGSQLRVFSSPSLRGPLRGAVQYSAVQYSMREVSRGKCLLCEKGSMVYSIHEQEQREGDDGKYRAKIEEMQQERDDSPQ